MHRIVIIILIINALLLHTHTHTHTQTSGAPSMIKDAMTHTHTHTHTHKPLEPPPDFIIRRRRMVSNGYETMPKTKKKNSRKSVPEYIYYIKGPR